MLDQENTASYLQSIITSEKYYPLPQFVYHVVIMPDFVADLQMALLSWNKTTMVSLLRQTKNVSYSHHSQAAGARWESMRREAESLMKASEVSGNPS